MTQTPLKRYNLALPEPLFNDLQALADKEHTTVLELLRRFVKLGLVAMKIQETPGAAIFIREGDTEREIVMF